MFLLLLLLFVYLQVNRGGANKWGGLLAAVYGRAFSKHTQ